MLVADDFSMYDEAALILAFEAACTAFANEQKKAIRQHNEQKKAIRQHNERVEAIRKKPSPYRESRENTEATLYPSKRFSWNPDSKRLPLLVVDGPYPVGPDGNLLRTPNEVLKNHNGESVDVPGRLWQWWERVFDLLIPHLTQTASKYYWYVWEDCESAGIFRVALMLNSEREKTRNAYDPEDGLTKQTTEFCSDTRLFDNPAKKTLSICRYEAKNRMREESWFLRNSFDPPPSTARVKSEQEQKQRDKETRLRHYQFVLCLPGRRTFLLHDGKNFTKVLYSERYSKPAAPKGLSLGHREQATGDAAGYIASGGVSSEAMVDVEDECSGNLCARLKLEGYTNKEIAELLRCSVRTVLRSLKEFGDERFPVRDYTKSTRNLPDRISPRPLGDHPAQDSQPHSDGRRLPFRIQAVSVMPNLAAA